MIKSMTGFGRAEIQDKEKKITVEMKGVNHRYLDVNIRMPKKLNFFETSIRNLLKEYVSRGKVDIFISYEDLSESQVSLKYNEALASEYLGYLRQMEEKFGLENDIRVSTLSRYPEILTMEEQAVVEQSQTGAQRSMQPFCGDERSGRKKTSGRFDRKTGRYEAGRFQSRRALSTDSRRIQRKAGRKGKRTAWRCTDG